jgi:cytochrome c oxidase subunit 3
MLNTIVLLASGARVTWAHNTIVRRNRRCAKSALIITVGLGLFFTFLQVAEYGVASFSISDRIYGSAFFVATGFHGAHVIIGSSFLLVCLYRIFRGHFSAKHHAGLEAAAWYWHFVDVVWICLYLCVYWWPFAL